jgi:hypothetical protein
MASIGWSFSASAEATMLRGPELFQRPRHADRDAGGQQRDGRAIEGGC